MSSVRMLQPATAAVPDWSPAVPKGERSPQMLFHADCRHSRTSNRRPRGGRSWLTTSTSRLFAPLKIAILLFSSTTAAALINFENCLSKAYLSQEPTRLQWVPHFVDAKYIETTRGVYNLSVVFYGNVSGQSVDMAYPLPDSPTWSNPENTFGKLVNFTTNVDGADVYTTLRHSVSFLTFSSYQNNVPFCDRVFNGTECPVAPVFYAEPYDPYALRQFSVSHELTSSYSFATLSDNVRIQSGSSSDTTLGCVTVTVSPSLGGTLEGVLAYIPVVILAFVAFATIFAAVFSPWGSSDPFRWTTNWGRDSEVLRLVTPGFGDCLQYIQFIVLAGSLSLSYPGFFQPVISQAAWSNLMFNESFVAGDHGIPNPVDGIYVTNGTYGLTRTRQLVGMSSNADMWAGMVIWTLVIIGIVIVGCQALFAFHWASRLLANNPQEGLRRRNWPFTGGCLVRVVCNYFLLPIVSLSFFQMLTASHTPGVETAFAVILIVLLLGFAVWILRLIFTTKPRSLLFDDMNTNLLYGPMYNTYSDDAASFALIPALLNFVRGIAIGVVQVSGIAQLVVLAICEVVLVLTLHAFRPFQAPTHMNAYHTVFASCRLAIILLSVAFVPALGVTEKYRGWIGYAILLVHALVLVFGFWLQAVTRIVEISARLAGAGGDGEGEVTRGGLGKVFGVRQLSRRSKRPQFRRSMASDAAVLTDDAEIKSAMGGRSRSLSASSAILLNQRMASGSRLSGHLDHNGYLDEETPGYEHSGFSLPPNNAANAGPSNRPHLAIKTNEAAVGFYRAPRARRPTGELMTPGSRSRGSWPSGVMADSPDQQDGRDRQDSIGRPLGFSPPQGTPPPAYLRERGGSDSNVNDPRDSNVDYAVREVDFYYGVRGPALSSQPTRKLKTGPADPVGPVSAATGWFKGKFSRKTKDNAKGFEVVRSSRVPPAQFRDEDVATEMQQEEPYQDSPAVQQDRYLPGQRTRSGEFEHGTSELRVSNDQLRDGGVAQTHDLDALSIVSSIQPDPIVADTAPTVGVVDLDDQGSSIHFPSRFNSRASNPPTVGDFDFDAGSFQLPSRFNSEATSYRGPSRVQSTGRPPVIPQRSAQRDSADLTVLYAGDRQLSTIMDEVEHRQSAAASPSPPRMPFTSGASNRRSSDSHSRDLSAEIENAPASSMNYATTSHRGSVDQADRPDSFGYVNQFRASDSIQTPVMGDFAHAESQAELVTEATTRRN